MQAAVASLVERTEQVMGLADQPSTAASQSVAKRKFEEEKEESKEAPLEDDASHPALIKRPAVYHTATSFKNDVTALYDAQTAIADGIFEQHRYKFTIDQTKSIQEQLQRAQDCFRWKNDQMSPCLDIVPPEDNISLLGLAKGQVLLGLSAGLASLQLGYHLDRPFHGDAGNYGLFNRQATSFTQLEQKNLSIYAKAPNVGFLQWWTDESFGQQRLSGPEPMSVRKVQKDDLAAGGCLNYIYQKDSKRVDSYPQSELYVLDYSYLQKWCQEVPTGFPADREKEVPQAQAGTGSTIDKDKPNTGHKALGQQGTKLGQTTNSYFAPSAVALFHLEPTTGQLFPIAIQCDAQDSQNISGEGKAPVVFNDRTSSQDGTVNQQNWQWRYAKHCVQVATWQAHELGIHLCHTHLVEEALIVAINRTIPVNHIVFQLLKPHWYKTLSLNAQARLVLVPRLIGMTSGFTLPGLYNVVAHFYNKFHYTNLYVPNDLKLRGFPATEEAFTEAKTLPQFKNALYARTALAAWNMLKKFVKNVLTDVYQQDAHVASDRYVQDWATEMNSPNAARMSSFPKQFTTIDELADAVTMVIHIAAIQHSAVNYVQQYYMSFVPNQPSALYRAVPSEEQMKDVDENFCLHSLPLDNPQHWMLMRMMTELLSKKVDAEYSLAGYANFAATEAGPVQKHALALSDDLQVLNNKVVQFNEDSTVHPIYDVVTSDLAATSILI